MSERCVSVLFLLTVSKHFVSGVPEQIDIDCLTHLSTYMHQHFGAADDIHVYFYMLYGTTIVVIEESILPK